MKSAFGIEHSDNIEKAFGSNLVSGFKRIFGGARGISSAGKHAGAAGPGSGLPGKRKLAGAHKMGVLTDSPSRAINYSGAGKRSTGYLGRHASPGVPGKRMKT